MTHAGMELPVSHIEQFLQWDPTPLGARSALALSRVLQPLNPASSAVLYEHARYLAFAAGEHAEEPAQVPALLMGEECLYRAFKEGCKYAAWYAAHFEVHPPIVWQGDWAMDSSGLWETRACVAESRDGFLPGLSVSQRGGDCEPSYGEPVATLDQAMAIAEAGAPTWHLARVCS